VRARPSIEAERSEGRSVKRACELLEVSRAAYYEARGALPGARDASDAQCWARSATSTRPLKAPTARPGCMPNWPTRGCSVAATGSPGS
jgi:hypothetical protein